MASTTTMNSWLEELAPSFIPPSTKPSDIRKYKDNFIRRVKNHNFGRTNQFDVAEKLAGLEEKFQVLNHDDVAAELFSRRMELKRDHDDTKWLPDILDLLLHLSHDPVKHTQVEDLEKLQPKNEFPPLLKWEDIEADDPIDRHDPIWSIPQYSDLSSDEDEEVAISSTQTSPASVKREHKKGVNAERIFDVPTATVASNLEAAQFWQTSNQAVAITETQAIREALFLLSGLPTSIFTSFDHGIKANPQYCIRHLEATTSLSLSNEVAHIASEVNAVRQWLRVRRDSRAMQVFQSEISDVLADFEQAISQEQNAVLHQSSPSGVISLLQLLQRVRKASLPLKAVKIITSDLTSNKTVDVLNSMYDRLDIAQYSGSSIDVETLLPVFLSTLTLYSKAVDTWLHTGRIEPTEAFFILENEEKARNNSTLWHDWFALSSEQDSLIPAFLKKSAAKIFTIGKTAAFLHHLGSILADDHIEDLGIAAAAIETAELIARSPLPFSATFEMILEWHLTTLLNTATSTLKHILETSCGLTRLLDAFDYLYLAKDAVILDAIESKMFDQIDRCMELWNDRFLLSDLLAEVYRDIDCVDADSITVHAAYTSSRSMENRRRSVKILAAVSISYHVDWPVANIILPASIAYYQRTALTLSQIRRAKFLLERRAYFYIQHMPLDFIDSNDLKITRLTHWRLSLFINILYAHFTNCVIQPLTISIHQELQSSSTGSLDDMISIHNHYISALGHACLSSTRMKPLRNALVSILDLCVLFTDLVTSSSDKAVRRDSGNTEDGDFEASSFISAQSRRRRRKQAAAEDYSSSEDEGGIGEGYSTFILDEDSSLIQEISKLGKELKKHVEFLNAGSRAVARSSSSSSGLSGGKFDVGERFEILADSLDGVFPSKGRMK